MKNTSNLDQELEALEKHLRQSYSMKERLSDDIDRLDPDDRHFSRMKADMEERLYRMYDKIEDLESEIIETTAKKRAIEADKLTGDNIYKVLIYFDRLYAVMDEAERREFVENLIEEIQVYPERQPNGQWLKSTTFKLPIIENDMEISSDNGQQSETVVSMSK